ncbi:hypothetical protein LCGC14_0356290 [marine sediment metagenome]|uniref:Large polyvalent protein associated domain-containing protein n=1 Tax=marine sediment metagenome TaxID=412755 RepID=A0A0F9TSG1_9ZZZZ
MPITSEQATTELRRRAATKELERREQEVPEEGGRFRGAGATGMWEPDKPKARLRDVPGIAKRGVVSAELGVAKGVVGTLDAMLNLPAEDVRKVGTPWAPSQFTRTPEEIRERTEPIREAKRKIISAQRKFGRKYSGPLAWTTRVVSEAIPYMGNAMVGGIVAGPVGAATVGFVVEGDNAYDEAIASGATEQQAQTERVVVGSINAVIEAIQVGRILKFAKSGKHSLKAFIKLAKTKGLFIAGKEGFKNFGPDALRLSIEESIEEFTQEGVSLGVPAAFRGEYPVKTDGSPDWWAIGERLGEAALGGAVAAPFLGGAGAVLTEAGRVNGDKPAAPVEVPAEIVATTEPVTSDQAIGQQYGMMNEETDATLQYAEGRFRELKNKDDRSAKERRELTFLKKQRANVEALLDDATSKKPLVPGLVTPEGKRITPATMIVDQLETLPRIQPTEGERRRMGKVGKLLTEAKRWGTYYGLNEDMMLKLTERLDQYMESGPIKRFVYHPIKNSNARARDNSKKIMSGFVKTFEDLGIDFGKMIFNERNDVVAGFPLTDTERIGMYVLAQNEKGRKRVEPWFEDEEIDNAQAVNQVIKSVEISDEEMAIVQEIQTYIDTMSPRFFAAAERMGIEDITKEDFYMMLLTEDQDEISQHPAIEELARNIGRKQIRTPGEKATKERTGTKARARIDMATVLPQMIDAVERFIEVGPVAAKVGRSMDNPKFKKALNNATRGEGYKVMRRWLEDSTRGSADVDNGYFGNIAKNLRYNAVQFVLGFKSLTVAPKQLISGINAMTVRPDIAWSIMKRMARYGDMGALGNLKKDYAEASKKSKMMKSRDWNRDLIRKWDRSDVRKYFQGKRMSRISMAHIAYNDKATTTAVWLSAYEQAMIDLDGNEKVAIQVADDLVTSTQPMGNVEDLPGFFRGNAFEKMMTQFMNQPNKNWNMLRHDIYGKLRAGKITKLQATQRFMTGQIIPAVLLGMITRGRLPESPEEVLKDIASHMMGPHVFFGRFIYNAATGDWDPLESAISAIPFKGFEEGARTVTSAKRGDIQKTIEHGVGTYGAFTGKIPQQLITTTGGIIDLAQGETEDIKRIVYSEYMIKKNKPKAPTGRHRTINRPPVRRRR